MRAVRSHAAIVAGFCFLLLTAAPAFATTILVYHSFGVRSSMSISLAAFAAQLDYLEQSGHKVISMDELARCLDEGRNPPEKSVVIAIDDGWATVMQAFPELKRRDLPFTLFLPMAYVANKYCPATLSQGHLRQPFLQPFAAPGPGRSLRPRGHPQERGALPGSGGT